MHVCRLSTAESSVYVIYSLIAVFLSLLNKQKCFSKRKTRSKKQYSMLKDFTTVCKGVKEIVFGLN